MTYASLCVPFCIRAPQELSLLTTLLWESNQEPSEIDYAAKATAKAMSAVILSCNKTKLAYIHAGS